METFKDYFISVLLLAAGILLLTAREENTRQPSKGTVTKFLGIEIPMLMFSVRLRPWMQGLGAAFLVGGAVLGVISYIDLHKTSPATAGVSLVSATYTWGDWDPRRIDFRRAIETENGIPVGGGLPFRVYNLVVYAPTQAKGVEAWVEIEANDQKVVQTQPVFLSKGLNYLIESNPLNFVTSTNPRTWDIPEGCQKILFKLVLRQGGSVTETVDYEVPLTGRGDAWFTSRDKLRICYS